MNKALLLLLGVAMAVQAEEGFNTVEYQGETIQLARTYADFDEYKDDPDNLPPSTHQKVAQLVRSAPVATQYPTRKAASDALFHLMFPGYGLSMLGLKTPVALFSLEVPTANEDRFIAFVERSGAWVRVDDFLWPNAKGYIEHAELRQDKLVYVDRLGTVIREQ
jgi:hypothetical protein